MNSEAGETLLVKPAVAAKMLAVSPRKLFDLTKRGEIPAVRLGRSVRYYVQTLLDLVKRKEACDGERGE